MMNDKQIREKALEIAEVCRMWDMSRTDTYKVAIALSVIAHNTALDWSNPLIGTGFKTVQGDG